MLKTLPELIASAKENVNTLTAIEAANQYNENNGILIDVREPSEFNEKSVAGAINIPRGVLEMQILNLYPSDETPIYIHCATGGRATLAGEQLQRLGYKNVVAISCPFSKIYEEYALINNDS